MAFLMNPRQRRFFEVLGLDLAGFSVSNLGAELGPKSMSLSSAVPQPSARPPSNLPHPAPARIEPVAAEPEREDVRAPASANECNADNVGVDEQSRHAIAAMEWPTLKDSIAACRACSLGNTRQNAVVGAGSPTGSWFFVGEAPGAEEDRRGEAFVGRGGQLLDAMLAAMSLSRTRDVYIANVLKCRPPNNRDPQGPEVQSCLPYLERQIALVQPRIVVAMGRFAAQSLLQTTTPIGQLRGRVWEYRGIPLVVTYHPAYLLRNPLDKRKVWEDLKLALSVYPKDSPRTDAMA
ncbi:MAG: uracil-DNA glycosylase [Acidithiobacillus sp.]